MEKGQTSALRAPQSQVGYQLLPLAFGKEVLHRGVALPTRQLDQQETPTTPTTNSLFSSGTSSRAGERERVFSTLLVLEHEG